MKIDKKERELLIVGVLSSFGTFMLAIGCWLGRRVIESESQFFDIGVYIWMGLGIIGMLAIFIRLLKYRK